MVPRAGYVTPLLHVGDVQRSIDFYTRLGFFLVDTEGEEGCIGWARLHCEGGALMFLLAEEPPDPAKHGVVLYLYAPDLPALCEHLAAAGLEVPKIRYPEYMRSGEIELRDPDGNTVLVGHWGETEHAAWQHRLAERKK